MKLARLELALAAAAGIGFMFVLCWITWQSDDPVAAAGIALQTFAGAFTAVQLWANKASDAFIIWAARQIEANRWYVAGLLNGRATSLLIATIWAVASFFALQLPTALNAPDILGWPLAIVAIVFALTGVMVWCLALFIFASTILVADNKPLPSGAALTGLHTRLDRNDWIWPFVALAFLAGGILQITAG